MIPPIKKQRALWTDMARDYVKYLEDRLIMTDDEIKALEAENQRYREALEHIARMDCSKCPYSIIRCNNIALKALETGEEER